MRRGATAAVAALFLTGATGICLAQTAAPAAPSIDELVGKKLSSIDGSSITLSPAEGGMAREIASPTGAIQRTYFAFINDRLGTVADANDIRKVTGVFRRMEGGFEVEYADGSTETLSLNPGGGLTQETISAASNGCVSWYPEGHAFSLDERKSALAAFAVKLGLADGKIEAFAKPDCGRKAAPAASDAIKTSAPAPVKAPKAAFDVAKPAIAIPVPTPKPLAAATGAVAAAAAPTAALAAEAQAIEVRKSEVHAIDPEPVAAPAVTAGAAAAVAATAPQMLASATPPPAAAASVLAPALAAIAPAAPDTKALDEHGASGCLSVESDGSHWGFRNHCGYTVQFSYCLMGGNQLAACRDGAVPGSVSGNGFGALVADESLKETDAKHDFRWVACQGGAGEVIPHLDQFDPPSGRCVR